MRSYRPLKNSQDARISRLRDVEPKKRSSRLRDAEHIARGKNNVLFNGHARKRSGILTLRQATPEVEAPTRHDSRLDV
jgi:hypothetical protein